MHLLDMGFRPGMAGKKTCTQVNASVVCTVSYGPAREGRIGGKEEQE